MKKHKLLSIKNETDNKNDMLFTLMHSSTGLGDVKFSKKNFQKALKKEIEGSIEHFKNDGWDLEARGIVENVLYNTFGTHLSELIYGIINEVTNTVTEYSLNKVYIKLPPEIVYYNPRNDKIIIKKITKKVPKHYVNVGRL